MVYAAGVPKGMRMILEELGINIATLKADGMRTTLARHVDFCNERLSLNTFKVSL